MHFWNSYSLNITDIDFTKHNYSDGQLIWVRVPDWEMGVKILAFIPMIFLGFFGNSAIIVVVVQLRSMRTCTNLFITNMAVADLLTVLFSSWSYLVYDFYQNYVLGRFCKVEGFIQVICLLSSAFSLIVISCDRLLGIVFPFSRRLTKRQALIIIICIWVSAIACASPLAIWRSLSERQWADYLEIWCSENTHMKQLKYYWLIILTLLFYLPLTVMTVAYGVIICSLDRYEQQLFLRENPIKLKYRRRVIRMLFVYLLNCFWCWFTFQVVVLYRHFKPTSYELPNWYRRVFFVAHLFTYANGAINPIIYGACSESFRKGFRLIFSCFYQKNQVTPTPPDNKRHNNNQPQRRRHSQLTHPNEERQQLEQIENKQNKEGEHTINPMKMSNLLQE